MIDEQSEPYHLPLSVQADQIITTPPCDYDHIARRDVAIFEYFVKGRVANVCNWVALVDDDAYLNVPSIVAKSRCIDHSKPHVMGAIYHTESVNFVHGDFRLFSQAALPLIAHYSKACKLGGIEGFEDVALATCFHKLGRDQQLPPESFGSFDHDNNLDMPHVLNQVGKQLLHGKNVKCSLDFIHKLPPGDMMAYHTLTSKLPPCEPSDFHMRPTIDPKVPLIC